MVALYLLHRALQAVSAGRAALVVYGLYAQPLRGSESNTARPDARWHVTETGPADAITREFPRPQGVLEARWAAGARCFTLTRDRAFAGHIWIQTDSYREDEIRCNYMLATPETTVWDFDVYIAPQFRVGRGLQRLWADVDRTLHAEGRRWTLSRISLFNAGSVRSHQRLGAVRIGWVGALVLPLAQLTVTRGFPWLHLSASARHRPQVRARAPHKT